MNTSTLETDSIKLFFDRIELLKWANKNQDAIHQLTEFIENRAYDKNLQMRAYNELAENQRWLGDPDRALSILEKVERRFEQDPTLGKIELVRFYFYKGKNFRLMDLIDSALFYEYKALEFGAQILNSDDPIIGDIWMDLGHIQTSKLGNYKKGLEYNLKAQDIFHKSLAGWHIKKAVLYYALASNFRELGDFERAANYARMAELIYGHYGDQFTGRMVSCKVVQGNCYFENGNFKEANAVYEHVIEIFTTKVKPSRDALLRTLSNNGVALLNLKEYGKARKAIERSIELNPLLFETDSLDLVYAYSNLALIFEEINQFDKAKELLEKCMSISLALFGEKHIEVFEGYRYLGMYYAKLDQHEDALYYYQKALMAAFEDFDEKSIYVNPKSFSSIPSGDAFNILFGKARAFMEKYTEDQKNEDLLAAFNLYKIAYELIREAASSDFMEESLLNIPETFKDDLNYGVECVLALYESTNDPIYLDQLLQFVETNKYFLLQSSVVKSKSKETLGIPDSAYQKEKNLLEQINTLKQEINNSSFESAQEEYDKRFELLKTTIEWENIRKQWETSEGSSYTFSDIYSTLSLDSIRSRLIGENDILLEYFQTLDTLYTIVVDMHKESILKTPRTKDLEIQMDTYLEHMFNKDSSNSKGDFIEFVNASYFLYEKLVYPVLSISNPLHELNDSKRLIIIPDGQLSIMPFESLIQEIADTTIVSYWGLNYLCRDYIINYAYSVNILGNNQIAKKKDQNDNILAFSYSSSNKKNTVDERDDEYGELPYSAVELRNIRRWIKNGKFFDGEYATESAFKSNAQDHDIIHLALHGFGDTEDILNSQIIFKSPGNDIEDGKLYAHELYGIDLSGAELAVLSACETGIGKTMRGEGVYSLARGFAYAGCPAMVMSLWKVNDKTTAEIMDYFYENLANGLQKDMALQKAKLTFIENSDDLGAHPSNWAAFIALGNNRPVQLSKSIFQRYYWVILAMIIISFVIFYQKRKMPK